MKGFGTTFLDINGVRHIVAMPRTSGAFTACGVGTTYEHATLRQRHTWTTSRASLVGLASSSSTKSNLYADGSITRSVSRRVSYGDRMKKGDRVQWLDLIHLVRTPGKTSPYSTTHCSRSFHHDEAVRMRKASPTCLLCVVNILAFRGRATGKTKLRMR